jgi:hypothetical protein
MRTLQRLPLLPLGGLCFQCGGFFPLALRLQPKQFSSFGLLNMLLKQYEILPPACHYITSIGAACLPGIAPEPIAAGVLVAHLGCVLPPRQAYTQ